MQKNLLLKQGSQVLSQHAIPRSFCQILQEEVVLSFCGNIGKKGLKNMQFLLEKIAPKTTYKVEACFDNDDAGNKMFEEIKSYFSLKLVKRNFPSGKDFNENVVNLCR